MCGVWRTGDKLVVGGGSSRSGGGSSDGWRPTAGTAGPTARPEQRGLARTAQSYIKQHAATRDIAGGDVSCACAKLGRTG